jgi:hypothetical protein
MFFRKTLKSQIVCFEIKTCELTQLRTRERRLRTLRSRHLRVLSNVIIAARKSVVDHLNQEETKQLTRTPAPQRHQGDPVSALIEKNCGYAKMQWMFFAVSEKQARRRQDKCKGEGGLC